MSQAFRELILLPLNAAAKKIVECPDGMVIRMVGLTASVALAGTGDQAQFQITRGNDVLLDICSPGLNVGVNRISAAIGIAITDGFQTNQSLATGDISYAADTRATFALPDIWWPFSIEVSYTMMAGTMTLPLLLYERQFMKRTFERTSLTRMFRHGKKTESAE